MNTFLLSVKLAFVAMLRNPMRTALTMLGIIIAVTSLTIVSAIGVGARSEVQRSFDVLGSNVLRVLMANSGTRTASRLNASDADAIARDMPQAASVSSTIISSHDVFYEDRTDYPMIIGATPPYRAVRHVRITVGEFWDEQDELSKARVCVIGNTLRKKLFGTANPIGQDIRVGRTPYRVIGMFAPLGISPPNDDWDDAMFVPISTMRVRIEQLRTPGAITGIMIQSDSEVAVPKLEESITSLLRERHYLKGSESSDFRILNFNALAKGKAKSGDLLSSLLAAVAAISLVVGGIGVTNVMFVSIEERKREIGICLAIGAGPFQVALQFLIESLTLSIVGGLIGAIFGVIGSGIVAKSFGWNTYLDAPTILVGMGASILVGITFGFIPAMRAAQLDPITAMRRE